MELAEPSSDGMAGANDSRATNGVQDQMMCGACIGKHVDYLRGFERVGLRAPPPGGVTHAVPAGDRTRTSVCGRRVLVERPVALEQAAVPSCPECALLLVREHSSGR